MNLTRKDREILTEVHTLEEEVFGDIRKGVPQSRYIIKVDAEAEYYCVSLYDYVPVPEHLVGVFMNRHSRDLSYTSTNESIRDDDWVRCKETTITKKVWEEVK